MKILKIDVSKKKDNFDKIYEELDSFGNYLVYSGNFILITFKENLKDFLKGEKEISIKEIKDIDKEIEQKYIRNWLREEIIKNEVEEAKEEINERIQAMSDILTEAQKKLIELEGNDKNNGKTKTNKKLQKEKKSSK